MRSSSHEDRILLNRTPDYHPHLDGIRCLSIVLVVLFHFGIGPFTGGFIGVDVFFTLSGFLIIGAIVRQSEAGTFKITDFWQRRIRRLFPGILATILLTSLAGIAIMNPVDLAHLGKQSALAIVSLINFDLIGGQDYFELTHPRDALIHFWSLAVEEQFYLFFPLLAWCVMRQGGADRYRRNVVLVLLALSLASFALAHWWVLTGNKLIAYYMMPSRFGQLALGGVLALYYEQLKMSRAFSSLAASIAILVVVFLSVTLDGQSSYPGLAALGPTVAALLLIAATHEGVWRPVFCHPWIGYIGRMSFVLYLVHWPVWVFFSYYLGRTPDVTETAFAVVLTFVVSAAIYHGIENPIRFAPAFKGKRMYHVIAPGLVLAALMFNVTFQSDGLPQRVDAEYQAYVGKAARYHLEHFGGKDIQPGAVSQIGEGPLAVLFVGDSKMRQFGHGIRLELEKRGQSALMVTHDGCPFYLDAVRITRGRSLDRCVEVAQQAVALASQHDLPIVFARSWNNTGYYAELTNLEGERLQGDLEALNLEKTQEFIAQLSNAGRVVYLLAGEPVSQRQQPPVFCFLKPQWLVENCYEETRIGLAGYVTPAPETTLLTVLGDSVRPIAMAELYCDGSNCERISPEGQIYYSDATHLSLLGSARFAGRIFAAIERAP